MYPLIFQPPVIAHRGASAYAPENTMAAFTKAAVLGMKWVEFDVMQAACGEVIIMHDDLLERTTNASGDVIAYPYAFLRTLDAGAWFHHQFASEPIPTLEQACDFFQQVGMNANIEIKVLPGLEEQCVLAVLAILENTFPTWRERILFSSFSVDALIFLRQYAPDANLGLLLHEWCDDWEKIANDLSCVSIHVFEEIMTMQMAQQIKKLNKQLLCYTVNSPARAKTLYSWGVDAVFSDNPDQIVDAIR